MASIENEEGGVIYMVDGDNKWCKKFLSYFDIHKVVLRLGVEMFIQLFFVCPYSSYRVIYIVILHTRYVFHIL